mgnify:FL=1
MFNIFYININNKLNKKISSNRINLLLLLLSLVLYKRLDSYKFAQDLI